jgi:hypothetical protein
MPTIPTEAAVGALYPRRLAARVGMAVITATSSRALAIASFVRWNLVRPVQPPYDRVAAWLLRPANPTL